MKIVLSVVLTAVAGLIATATAVAEEMFPRPGDPVAVVTFDVMPGNGSMVPTLLSPGPATLQPGRFGLAAQITDKALLYRLPTVFSPESGSIEMWIRPDYDSGDNAYHRFFDLAGQSTKANVFLYKSGDGGKNGLFMVVYDQDGTRVNAMAVHEHGYSWHAGEWHHIGGSWDARAGLVNLFVDGRQVAVYRGEPFVLGEVQPQFAIGGMPGSGNLATGLIDEFRFYRDPATREPVVRTGSSAPTANPWHLLDGDTGDASAWTGRGSPNFVEIQLPESIDLERVIVHPGNRRYASNPSTECSPKEFTVQGWINDAWKDLSSSVPVPRYEGQKGEFRVAADIATVTLRRFRIWVTALYDEGKRVHSPDTPVVAQEDRSLAIREIEWRSARQVAESQAKLERARETLFADFAEWEKRFASEFDPIGRAVQALYGEALATLKLRLKVLQEDDEAGLVAVLGEWERTQLWLEPWQNCESGSAVPAAGQDWVGELLLTVDTDDTPHEFFPAKVALDLRVVERIFGAAADPYTIEVTDTSGTEPDRCNSRFDRITPGKGTLTWTMRNRAHARFVVRFRAKPDSPPETGMCTLGDGDHFYFEEPQKGSLPHDMWSCVFLDWDGDGRQDALAGSWNDFCHLWRNVGTAQSPAFSMWEHFLVMDDREQPLATDPKHHACTFSMVMPIDFDGDGRMDLFLDRYFSGAPSFHRNLGPTAFPVVAQRRQPVGLSRGKMAFGDLNGDGVADAVVIVHADDRDTLRFHPGKELDTDGAPVFGAGQDLAVEVTRAFGGGWGAKRTTVALADTDGDGDLDLYVVGPPNVTCHENTGTEVAFSFGAGELVEYRGKPLDVGFYYPSISWSDYDGDGDLDLVKLTGGSIYLNQGDREHVRLTDMKRAPLTRQRMMGRSNLKCQAMLDWDRDGDLDHLLPHSRSLDLQVTEWQDGFFRRVSTVEVDPNKRDWYGCPDPTEYEALYALLMPFDWDADGDVDLFFNSEHAWRFGYLHYYENLGGNRFAPEVEWRPGGGGCDHVRFVEGKNGNAALIDDKTFLDYLSYRCEGNFDPAGGTIRFWFKPAWGDRNDERHTFFHTGPTPAVNGIRAEPLRRFYCGQLPDVGVPPPFALFATERGTLRLDAGTRAVESGPLVWQDDRWHRIEAVWGASGLRVSFDGVVVGEADSVAPTVPHGTRMHVGSQAWMGVQREREYPGRWQYHPTDFSLPAGGVLDDFEILGPDDQALFTLTFDGHTDSTQGVPGNRLRVGYRCTPGFADINGDGYPDLIMMLSDGRRGRGGQAGQEAWGEGRLYVFFGAADPTGGIPPFGPPVLLTLSDGSPFRCHIRTKITPVDWDADGLIDVITSTEDHGGAKINRAVDFFRNVGTPTSPVFAARKPMSRLNTMLDAQHDVKLNAVDLTGNGRADLVTSTDPGTCVFYRSFLEEKPVGVTFERLNQRKPSADAP